MLPSQDPIEGFTFASTWRLEIAHMVEIQDLKDMHVQEMDGLQSQIFKLITNLWALTTFNAWGKTPMTTIEWTKLEELESKHKHHEYHEHQYTQQVYNDL